MEFIIAPIEQKQFDVAAVRNSSSVSCKFRESIVWSLKVIMLLHPLHIPDTSSRTSVKEEFKFGKVRFVERLGMNEAEGAGDKVGAGDMNGALDTC